MKQILIGDCRDHLARLRDAGAAFHCVVTDPPYELGLFDKAWDGTGVAFDVGLWQQVFNVLRPGGYLAAFAAPRQYHLLAAAVEQAGFTLHPFLIWRAGNGLPKPINLAELFDRENSPRRRILGQRNGSGFTKADVVHGGQNRSRLTYDVRRRGVSEEAQKWLGFFYGPHPLKPDAEVILLAQRPIAAKRMIENIRQFGVGALNVGALKKRYGGWPSMIMEARRVRQSHHGAHHPSVKPVRLMEDLCLLLCPPGGTILDPFAGTGTTGIAAKMHGYGYTLIEANQEMSAVIERRLSTVVSPTDQALHVPPETTPFSAAHVTPPTKLPKKQKRVVQHRNKVRAYREGLPARGLRSIQLWVWDVQSGEYVAEAWRQSQAIASALGQAVQIANMGGVGIRADE